MRRIGSWSALFVSLSMSLLALPSSSFAWPADGLATGSGSGLQDQSVMVSDGQGGAIVAWRDTRSDAGDIYVQRLTPWGEELWAANGVAVCSATNEQFEPALAMDGSGGVIVAWADRRADANGDIYAQRIDASGAPQWASDGVPLVTGPSNNDWQPDEVRMVSDGLGGAILVFQDNRHADGSIDPSFSKIWAQRVSGSGAALWGNGVAVGTAIYAHQFASVVADGQGGAVVTWMDGRVFGDYQISVQRLNPASGAGLWGPDGVYACAAPGWQWYPEMVADGTGGVIVAWDDRRNDPYGDIYAQRLDGNGVAQWASNGEPLVTGPSRHDAGHGSVQLVSDGAGGAILALADNRNADQSLDPSFAKVWLQRVSAGGAALWGNGVPVSTVVYAHTSQHLVADGEGGAVVAWQDGRVFGDYNISVQRVDASGTKLWGADGQWACSAPGEQGKTAVVEDGQGGIFVAWRDQRADAADLYVTRACLSPQVVAVEEPRPEEKDMLLRSPWPNPVEGVMNYALDLPNATAVTVDLIDIAGRTRARLLQAELESGRHVFSWSVDRAPRPLRAGIYYLRARAEDIAAVRRVVVIQ